MASDTDKISFTEPPMKVEINKQALIGNPVINKEQSLESSALNS